MIISVEVIFWKIIPLSKKRKHGFLNCLKCSWYDVIWYVFTESTLIRIAKKIFWMGYLSLKFQRLKGFVFKDQKQSRIFTYISPLLMFFKKLMFWWEHNPESSTHFTEVWKLSGTFLNMGRRGGEGGFWLVELLMKTFIKTSKVWSYSIPHGLHCFSLWLCLWKVGMKDCLTVLHIHFAQVYIMAQMQWHGKSDSKALIWLLLS